jgi:PEP-CTERM motif
MRVKASFAIPSLFALGLLAGEAAPANAGLINPASTVDINFEYENPGPIVTPSGVFNTAAPGPFSLATPIYPPNPALHTTEPYNLDSVTGFWFTNTQVTIYNNGVQSQYLPNPAPGDPGIPFCFSSMNTGSACTDAYNTFDFKFTNEDITGVSIDPSSSADFPVATFGSHLGLQLVSPNEFTVDVTGADPAYLSTLVIDVKTGGRPPTVPEPSTWAMMLIGFASLGLAGYRRAIRPA